MSAPPTVIAGAFPQAGPGSSRAAALSAVRAARSQLVATGAARRSAKTGVFKPGARMRELLRSIAAPSALAPSEPEALVWDPLLAAARLPGGHAELAAYLQYVRNTVCGQDEHAKAAMARRVRADWARATGGFAHADCPQLELPPGATSFVPGLGAGVTAPQLSAPATDEAPAAAAAAATAAASSAPTAGGIAGECYPSSLDEAALLFLHLHHFDVSRAQLLLAAYLGAGKELAAIQQLEELKEGGLAGGAQAPPQRGPGRAGASARAASAGEGGGQNGGGDAAGSDAAAQPPRAKPSSRVGGAGAGASAGSSALAGSSSTREAGGLGLAIGVNGAPGDACVLAGVAGVALEPQQLGSHALRAAWGGGDASSQQHACDAADVDARPYLSVAPGGLTGAALEAASRAGSTDAGPVASAADAVPTASTAPLAGDVPMDVTAAPAHTAAARAPSTVHHLAAPAAAAAVPPAPTDAPLEDGTNSSSPNTTTSAPAAADACGDEEMLDEAPLEAPPSSSLPTAAAAAPVGAYKMRMTEPQRQRMWKQWLVDARVVLQSRSSSWDSLVHLRAAAAAIPPLNPFASGGGSAVLSGEVTQACSTIGTRLKAAVRWRARVRDALCGTLSAPGPAPVSDFEELLAEAGRCQVDMSEPAHVAGFIREAKDWLREADELLRRSCCAAGEAVKAELLHAEDAALAGPEGSHVPMPGVRTASISDVPPRPPKGSSVGPSASASLAAVVDEGSQQQASSKKASPPLLEQSPGDPLPPGSTEKAGRSLRAKRPRPADVAESHAAGVGAGGDGDEQQAAAALAQAGLPAVKTARSRGGTAAAQQPPPVALFYGSRYAALQHAEVAQPPVFIDELVAHQVDARCIPLCLHPQAADVESKLRRCRELAAQIVVHLPNASSPQHSRGPAGPRLPQAHGLSVDVLGSAALVTDGVSSVAVSSATSAPTLGASGGAGAAASSSSAAAPPGGVDHDLASSSMLPGGTGSLADGSAAYASFHAYNDHPHGSGIGALLGGGGRRARMPWSHLDALARDVRETGVAFCEGEVVKLLHAEALSWLARSHEAVSFRRRCTLPELRELLAEAEALPVDMAERVAVLRVEARRAEAWVSAAHDLIRPRTIGTQSTRTARTSAASGPTGTSTSGRSSGNSLSDVKHALEQVASGLVAASEVEVASLESTVLSAQTWLARVAELLDRESGVERALPGGVSDNEAATAAVDRPSGSGSMPSLRDAAASSSAPSLLAVSARPDGAASAVEAADTAMDGAPTTVLTIDALTALLREADDIPIALEEYELLAAEVAARKWASRARTQLCQPSGAKLEALRELLKDIKSVRQNSSSCGGGSRGGGGGDGADGHHSGAQLAQAALARLPVLAEEREIKQVLKAAEELLVRVRRLQSTLVPTSGAGGGNAASAVGVTPAAAAHAVLQPPSSTQRRVEVARVSAVLAHAAALPVNLSAYMQDLSDAVERCQAWEAVASPALARVRAAVSAAAALRALRLAALASLATRSGATSATGAEPQAEVPHGASSESAASIVLDPAVDSIALLSTAVPASAAVLGDSARAGERTSAAALSALRALPPLYIDHLRDLVSDAEALPCIPEGEQELRAALAEVDAWLHVSADLLPRPPPTPVRRREPHHMALDETPASTHDHGSERIAAESATRVVVDEPAVGVVAHEVAMEQLGAGTAAVVTTAKVPVEFLRRVLEGAIALPVDVDAHGVQQLVVAYHAARKWQLSARATLASIGALTLPSSEERLDEAAFDVTLALSTGIASSWLAGIEGEEWPLPAPPPAAQVSAARAHPGVAIPAAVNPLAAAALSSSSALATSSWAPSESLSHKLEALQAGCGGLVVLCREEVALHHASALERWSTKARALVASFDAHHERVMRALMQGVASASHHTHAEGGAGASADESDLGAPLPAAAAAGGAAPQARPAGLRHNRPSDLPVVTAPQHITWDSLLARRLAGSAAVMAAAFWISHPRYGAVNAVPLLVPTGAPAT